MLALKLGVGDHGVHFTVKLGNSQVGCGRPLPCVNYYIIKLEKS